MDNSNTSNPSLGPTKARTGESSTASPPPDAGVQSENDDSPQRGMLSAILLRLDQVATTPSSSTEHDNPEPSPPHISEIDPDSIFSEAQSIRNDFFRLKSRYRQWRRHPDRIAVEAPRIPELEVALLPADQVELRSRAVLVHSEARNLELCQENADLRRALADAAAEKGRRDEVLVPLAVHARAAATYVETRGVDFPGTLAVLLTLLRRCDSVGDLYSDRAWASWGRTDDGVGDACGDEGSSDGAC